MNNWQEKMKQSSKDFLNIVWPEIKDWFSEGELIPVEIKIDDDLAKKFDNIAGVDFWQINTGKGIRGIGSRVQLGSYFKTITIRYKLASGGKTEFEKRQEAIKEDYLYPYWTIHAYIANLNPKQLLYVSCIKTKDLFFAYDMYPDIFWEEKNTEDGNIFLCVFTEDLKIKGFNVRIFDYKKEKQRLIDNKINNQKELFK